VLWFAESDGETMPDNVYYPKGTIFVINEWYGCKEDESNKGLYLDSTEVSNGIIEREDEMDYFVSPGPADSAIYSIIDGNSIADKMEDAGIYWEHCSKGAGSRVIGLETVRGYLKNSVDNPLESPGLYMFNRCTNLIKNIPVLPRDAKKQDDVDTGAEDHDYDALRYRLTTEINHGVTMAGHY